MKMRICYIASLGSTHTERWLKYFADIGHDVHLITSSANVSNSSANNVRLHILKRFGPHTRIINYLINSMQIEVQFNKIIKNIKPDIIHAHSIMDTTLLGAISGFHPFVVTPWGSDVLIAPKESKISKWIVKYVLNKADLITCDAEHIKEPLIELGANPDRIRLIYFGVDTQKFKPGEKDERLRVGLGIPDSPTIISLRRLNPIYDIESLINAIPIVLKNIPEAKFLIVGKGSQEKELNSLAKLLGILDSVKFVGAIPNDELPRYITSADIYVSTSLSDAGLAASTAEAMACGLPVIITDFGDNKKWVEDGVNGFIIPLKDPKSLAEKIIYLLKNEDVRKEFGRKNRKIIEEKNDYYKEMGKMEEIYKELIKKYKP